MITKDTIQKIQSQVKITDIVGDYVKLKKRGVNYLGLCPFHNEKTPSFTVSSNKEIYKCFGCGKSGNAINFLMEMEKYSYVEALRALAARYNIEVEETATSPEYKQQQQTSESLFIINKFAQEFFTDTLLNTEDGRDIALSYLQSRGFTEETIKKFQLGFNPESRDSFAKAATAAQYSTELLLKTGLVVQRDDRLQDNYRGRIIFPIHNQSGKVLGFGARIIKSNDRAPKYINTPENEIYIKSKILYGAYFARQAIDKANECLLVEGYTDVISLHQAGVENVVASGGTSLTTDQLRLIKKYSNNLTIVYDGDSAGIKAALRGLDLALEERLDVRLVLIPDGEDPDSFVNKVGAADFRKFVAENKKDFIIFQLEIALKDANNDSAKKSEVVNQVAETIARINRAEDFTKRQDYIRQVSQILKIDETGFNALVNKVLRDKIAKEESKNYNNTAAEAGTPTAPAVDAPADVLDLLRSTDEQQERGLIRALLEFGIESWNETDTVADFLFKQIEDNELENMFDNKDLVSVLGLYKTWYTQGLKPTDENFIYYDDPKISQLVIQLMQELPPEINPRWEEIYQGHIQGRKQLYKEEVMMTLSHIKLRKIRKLILENQKELQASTEPAYQDSLIKFNMQLKQLEKKITEQLGTVIFK